MCSPPTSVAMFRGGWPLEPTEGLGKETVPGAVRRWAGGGEMGSVALSVVLMRTPRSRAPVGR